MKKTKDINPKNFGGILFDYQAAFTIKTDANAYANGWRKQGNRARVLKIKRHYEVWVSKKRK